MASMRLQGICKSFGNVQVLKDLSLTVADGEFVVFVGPSGCGKSTLLRIVAGLEDASAGTVEIDGDVVNGRSPTDRGIAMVFQTYALYPHLTVRENMSLGLKQIKTPKAEIAERVAAASTMLSLNDYLDRRPAELSGGQRQRVAIGRAIVRKPTLFLFDEPLSNLDAALRVNTRLEIAILRRKLTATMVYVTHDQTEAMTLADRIVILKDGQIEQIGTPMELYNHPVNQFVAGFIGSPAINFIDPKLVGLQSLDPVVVKIGIRPEHISVDRDVRDETSDASEVAKIPDSKLAIAGVVSHVEQLGGDTNLYLDCDAAGLLCIRLFGEHEFAIGGRHLARIDEQQVHYFDHAESTIRRNSSI